MTRVSLRVLLVDDHEVVRSGIAALLKATGDIVVAGEAGTVRDAVEEADRTRPDVVVMDVRLADGKTNHQIGEELHLAEKTVKNYVSSILSKLEVARRAEAAAYLARHTTTPGA